MDKHDIVWTECIFMDLNSIFTILFGIRHRHGLCRQFVLFADRYKSRTDLHSNSGRKNKTARLYTHHLGNAFVFVKFVKSVFELPQGCGVFEHSRDIPEEDAFFRKIRDGPETRF